MRCCEKSGWGGKREQAGRKKSCLKKVPFNRRINENILNILRDYAKRHNLTDTEALESAILLQSNIEKLRGDKVMKITNKLNLPQPFVDAVTREYQYKDKKLGIEIDFLLGFKDNTWKLWIGKIGAISYDDDPWVNLDCDNFKDAILKCLDYTADFIEDVKGYKDNWVQFYI